VRIWAFISQKGGVGKSTLSCQLAVYAGQLGLKTIILDTDPQASAATVWHQARGVGESPPVVQVLPEKLGAVIAHIRGLGAYDLVIIDTAPHSDRGALAAISQADLIICPTSPSGLDLGALKDTFSVVELADARDRAIGVVNRVPIVGPAKGAVKHYVKAAEFIERFGVRVASTYIGARPEFVSTIEAGKGVTEPAKGKGVTETAKGTKAAQELISLWSELNETPPIVAPPTAAEETSP
jgi:chromosome partitioning protein